MNPKWTNTKREIDTAFGIGLRRAHFGEQPSAFGELDFLEILPENFMGFGGKVRRKLEELNELMPIVSHGVCMSLGGPDPLDERYLSDLDELFERINPPWFSDHLAISSTFGVQHHDLLPLPFTKEALAHVTGRIQQVQSRFDIPFLVENPSYYINLPGAEMTETQFITEVVERSGCGLLLDINNVYVNSRNQGFDPYEFVDQLPLEAALQVHMAGHDASGEFVIDTHGAPVADEVIELYEYTLPKIGAAWVLLEWDNDVPPLQTVIAESRRLRRQSALPVAQAV